jgi:NAD(P)-dependent dehydrogenase (short-subunit alcohol dehydrogenase family)
MSGERSRSSFAHDPRVDLNPEMSIEMEPMTAARNQTPTFVGKVAFVTGAGSGIGRTTSLAFAQEGASVVVADVSEQGNKETARMIEELGGQALAVRCDVTQSEEVRAALQQAVSAYGRLDIAFNNAGAEQKVSPTAEITEKEWDRIIAINLRGVFVCMKHEIPLMLDQGGGAIVNTSSGAGIRGFGGGAAYTAAKHGVIGLTKDSAVDYASSNIRVNAVCPGIIDTEMMQRFTGGSAEGRDRVIAQEPIRRMGTPEEVAAAVLWLCSDAASFVVGHAMIVDGGQTV